MTEYTLPISCKTVENIKSFFGYLFGFGIFISGVCALLYVFSIKSEPILPTFILVIYAFAFGILPLFIASCFFLNRFGDRFPKIKFRCDDELK